MSSIAIVTPWTDHLELAEDYFEAILHEVTDGDEIIVVDNASSPPLDFAKVRYNENLGFCGGCNLGLAEATADKVLFLNNDIELVRKGWLDELRQAIQPGVIAGPIRYGGHANVDGTPYPYIDGWCLGGMRVDLIKLGGFDTTLEEPAYFSDNLLCLEARAAGMSLRHVFVGLRHKENTTAGPAGDARVRAATTANQVRYAARVRELNAA